MSAVDVVAARLTHVGPVASRMRDADKLECAALGRTPKEALRVGLRSSLAPLTILVDGRPEAMMGVVPGSLLAGTGMIWMLGTDAMYRQPRALVARGPRVLAWLCEGLHDLSNIVSVDNARAIRFLRFLGFHVGGAVQHHGGVDFVPFTLHLPAIQAARVEA